MISSIKHKTIFAFENTPSMVIQRLHVIPSDTQYQRLLSCDIDIVGGKLALESNDCHGNKVHLCVNEAGASSMEIIISGRVNVTDNNGIIGPHDNSLPLELYKNHTHLSKPGPRLRELGKKLKRSMPAEKNGGLDILHELSIRILEKIAYAKGKTNVGTPAESAMEIGAGVCQDHTHAFIAVARLLGFSARYVSGYLSSGDGQIYEATHAWAEVYVGNLGWVGFDVSNGISPDERYIKIATGFDYLDVVPISGIRIGEGTEQISTEIKFSQQ